MLRTSQMAQCASRGQPVALSRSARLRPMPAAGSTRWLALVPRCRRAEAPHDRHSCTPPSQLSPSSSRTLLVRSSSSRLAGFHSWPLRSHGGGGRHHHEHEHEHGDHDEDDGDNANSAPVTKEDKARMEKECTDITMAGVYSNIGLAVFKFAGGILGNSTAMVADAVHSLSDLITDGITLWAARLTHKPQDADHPYGHGKFEAIGSLTISATLVATAGGIAWSAVESIQAIAAASTLSTPTGIALVAAIVSIGVKEVLYHATLRVGTRWNSKVVKANAWHHRTDSISTLVAMAGVGGAMIRMPILDPIAGLFVSGLIMKAAVELGWDALRDLTDENVSPALQADVSSLLHSMREEGVLSFHRLRGRAMGPFVLMDVHISVEPTISVSAAHQIAERARIRVRQALPVIAEFLVHVDVAQTPVERSVFEDRADKGAARDERAFAGVQVFTSRHVSEVVGEYRAARSETARLTHEASKNGGHGADSAHADSTAVPRVAIPPNVSVGAVPSSLSSSFKSFIDHAAAPDENDSIAPPVDLSTLMRPQALVERDVRRVLSDPHAPYAPHLRGVSHLTCHYSPAVHQLRVQLELAFASNSLTIAQAASIAKQVEARLLAQISDLHAVDIHLELTDDHIRSVKHVEPLLELTK